MGALNEVKIRVRSNALDLIEFTVEKMQQVTGLNPASIRTELTRLKRQGYLTSSPLPGARQGRGAPPHLYRLTDDDDKVDELARSVEAFYQPTGPTSFKPTSLHYEAAQTLLDKLESGQLPPGEQETALARIAHHLELAAADEGIAVYQDEKTEVVTAYLTLLRARLAMAQSHWPETERYLVEAHATFTVHQVEDGLQQTETLTNALTISRTIADAHDNASLCQRLLTALQGHRGHVPVVTVCRFLKQVQTIITADQKDITIQTQARALLSLVKTVTAESNQELVAEIRRLRQREMPRQFSTSSTEGRAEAIDLEPERPSRGDWVH